MEKERFLEIVVSALESDLTFQSKSEKKDESEWIKWKEDTEKVLRITRLKLSLERASKITERRVDE